jgi:prevent-host-death family protein
MKVVPLDDASLEDCVREAERDRIVLTRRGKPVAVLIGVKGLDLEQIRLGHSDEFWKLIQQRRAQKTMTRDELERLLAAKKKTTRGREETNS